MDKYEPYYLGSSDADDFAGVLANQPNIPFPYQLQQILNNGAKKQLEAIVSWLPNNQSFKVHDQDAFVKEVLPRYFKITKYKSFIRQLNSYGFQRLHQKGPSQGGYFHRLFIRDEPRYCKYITRQSLRYTGVNMKGDLRMSPEGECHQVEANIAMQAPAALSNNIDSPGDGDLVMFHGKQFYFMDAIGPSALLSASEEEYYPKQVGLPPHHFAKLKPLLRTNLRSSSAPSSQRIKKEFVKPNPSFYKPRTPTEARALLKRITGG
jgi:hypothetical protein